MTKQRELVLEVVRANKEHHTAAEIFALARIKMPTISRATVYNNLKALENMGMIRRITGDDAFDRYYSSFVPHGHMVCTRCGKMWDFGIESLNGMIADAVGEEFSSYELKVRILCKKCKNATQGG
jgi:Fur family peroxide stress response transcriptional regulator